MDIAANTVALLTRTMQARVVAIATSGADDATVAAQLTDTLEGCATWLATRAGLAPEAAWATARGLFAIVGDDLDAPLPAAFVDAALRDLKAGA